MKLPFHERPLVALAAAGLLALLVCGAARADDGQASAIAERIAQIRAMQPAASAPAAGVQRRELDAMWRFFGDSRAESVPLLRRELAAELARPRPNQLLLLDAGYFLGVFGDASDKQLSMKALLAIDPAAAIDRQQLFRFAHNAAQSRDARLLPLLEKAFLRGKVTVFLPQHGFTLDEVGVCAFLYGQMGAPGEAALQSRLQDPVLANKVLDILTWVGTPASVPAIAQLLAAPDPETAQRAAGTLMQIGGPQGREALLALDASKLPEKSRAALQEVQKQLQQRMQQSREQAAPPSQAAGRQPGAMPDAEVLQRLKQVYASHGRFDALEPADIMQSGVPRDVLLEALSRIREHTFQRVSNEALADIETTNAMLNALRFRPD